MDYERKAENYYIDLACNIDEQDNIVDSGVFSNQIWEIKQYDKEYCLFINNEEIEDSNNIDSLKILIETLEFYEEIRRQN